MTTEKNQIGILQICKTAPGTDGTQTWPSDTSASKVVAATVLPRLKFNAKKVIHLD